MVTMNDGRDYSYTIEINAHLNRRTLFIGKGKPIKKDR